jgi:hypothetical protein
MGRNLSPVKSLSAVSAYVAPSASVKYAVNWFKAYPYSSSSGWWKRRSFARRSPSALLRRTGTHSTSPLSLPLTFSQSARARCCRSRWLLRCAVPTGSRGAKCHPRRSGRVRPPGEGNRRGAGEPVYVNVKYRVRRAQCRAAGLVEPASPPEHTRHLRSAAAR